MLLRYFRSPLSGSAAIISCSTRYSMDLPGIIAARLLRLFPFLFPQHSLQLNKARKFECEVATHGKQKIDVGL